MKLSARLLKDLAGVNVFEPTDSVRFSPGDATTVYFQLVDASLDTAAEGFSPAGRRYMPLSGSPDATLTCILENLDDDKILTRAATQPFDEDPSIWALEILSTDDVEGTVQMSLRLVEPLAGGPTTRTTNGFVRDALRVCE